MKKKSHAKPFLKWAGGKTQLISEIEKCLPPEIFSDKFVYVEPFVGSGAVLFWMLSNFPNMEKAVINDINSDLINTYKIISSNPNELILQLKEFQNQFHELGAKGEGKEEYYYTKRNLYNSRNADNITQAALFIFLNRTCFNGLYRVNRNNLFNVPIGSYRKPMICDERNILAGSKALQKVEIMKGDFEQTLPYASASSFFYFDPPYKPLSPTSSFISYAENMFDDKEQVRLKQFCVALTAQNSKWMLSNSDVQNDNFLEVEYAEFHIKRFKVKRNINSKPHKRGELNELLITSYSYEQTLAATTLFG